MTKTNYLLYALIMVFLFLGAGQTNAESMSSENYTMEKGTVAGGGGEAESDNYSTTASVGQPSPIGDTESENYDADTGFLDDTDLDGDGVLIDEDQCPTENSTGFDANIDGCIDTISGLATVVATLPDDVLSDKTKTSLMSKVVAALSSSDREKDNMAINQLNAFINEVSAQRGKKISVEEADMLIQYAQNVITLINAG